MMDERSLMAASVSTLAAIVVVLASGLSYADAAWVIEDRWMYRGLAERQTIATSAGYSFLIGLVVACTGVICLAEGSRPHRYAVWLRRYGYRLFVWLSGLAVVAMAAVLMVTGIVSFRGGHILGGICFTVFALATLYCVKHVDGYRRHLAGMAGADAVTAVSDEEDAQVV